MLDCILPAAGHSSPARSFGPGHRTPVFLTKTSATLIQVAVLSAVAIVWLVVFLSAERLQRTLGEKVMTAFERLMGLNLTAKSVEMMLTGLPAFIHSL